MSDNKCISCLKNGKHKDIFSLKHKGKCMDSIFQMLTAIQLKTDCIDLNLICNYCTMQLKSFYNFRTKAAANYDKLFAMKFIPDETIDYDVTENDVEDGNYSGTENQDKFEVVKNNQAEFELVKIQTDNDEKNFEVKNAELELSESQPLGLVDINNLFKEDSKKWHCEDCNLIFPIIEEEEIRQHKLMEAKKKCQNSKNKSAVTVKKVILKPGSRKKHAIVRKTRKSVTEEQPTKRKAETKVKMFNPSETEQIKTSTIIKKLPGNFPQLISDINNILKSEDDEDYFNEDLDIEEDESESNRQGKKKFNYLNTGETKKGVRKKRGTAKDIPQKYICDVCGKEMSYASTLRVHMTMHTGKKFVCKLCGSGYVTRAGLTQHMNKHEQRKDFTCSFCGKSFYSNTDLLGHIYDKRQAGSHLDESCAPFTRPICEICGKTFYNMKTLKLHVSTHNQTKDYACTQCDRRFFHEHKLNMHMWTHEVQFRCMKCYQIFKQIDLKKHECVPITGHTYEPLDFECRICGQIFKGPGRYEQHQKTHSLKECKICKRKFNCSAKLFRCHLNTHNFKCSLCDKGFAKKTSWKYHVENQTCLKGKKELISGLF